VKTEFIGQPMLAAGGEIPEAKLENAGSEICGNASVQRKF
jgi:hypothetical protein